jgi:hypothetical protein
MLIRTNGPVYLFIYSEDGEEMSNLWQGKHDWGIDDCFAEEVLLERLQ